MNFSNRDRRYRNRLLVSTAISITLPLSIVDLLILAPTPAIATVIDGTTQTVPPDLHVPDQLIVGDTSTGGLIVGAGGTVTNTDGYIGRGSGSNGSATVSGVGALWDNSLDLFVGFLGTGALNVEAGGTVTNWFGFIGNSSTGNGTVTVSGAGTLWQTYGPLTVGGYGTGVLHVEAGGTVKNTDGTIGWGSTGNGTATVAGAGALWENSQGLRVGGSGTGALNVGAGGTVKNTDGYIGQGSTGNGTATVSGAGALWENSSGLSVGDLGTGALHVEAGGTVRDTFGYIGQGSTGNGSATISGAGALWENSFDLSVGFSGTGALDVEAGGTVKDAFGNIGIGSTGNGTATVSGAGALWENSQALSVGVSGTGALHVEAGGTVTNADGYIGVYIGGDGTATVSGAGAVWRSLGLYIGHGGTGALHVEAGGTVKNTYSYIGEAPTGNGTATVSGAGALLENSFELAVGHGGTGALHVEAGGTVKNTYGYIGWGSTGNGTATVAGAGALWENSLDLHVGYAGTGALFVSDGGTVRVGTSGAGAVSIANVSTSTGTLVVGAAEGDTAAAGTLEAAQLNFGDGIGTLVFNHTGTAYEFSAALASTGTGTHTLNHYSGTTILTADSSGFTGATNVNGGTLVVNGSLASSLLTTINAGGTLGGIGAVGNTFVNGGVFAPGSGAPGSVITVAGNLSFTGGTYQVFVNPMTSSFASVTGTADLSGATLAVNIQGNLMFGHYTVLTANGGVNGTFGAVTGLPPNTAFLSIVDTYDTNNAYLDVTKLRDFADAGLTPNQIATGEGLDSLSGGPLFSAVAGLATDAEARAAFDQLSGEIHASAKGMLVEDSRFIRDAATSRIRAAFGDGSTAALPVMAYGQGGPEMVAADTDRFAVWGQAFGFWGGTDSDGNAAAFDRSTGGVLAGADTLVGGWRVGLLGGYSHSNFDVDDRNSSGTADNYHLGLYGGTNWGAIAFRTAAAYSWSSLSTKRSVAFNGLADQLSADYDAGTAQIFGELAYKADAGGLKFEPFANLAYVSVHTDGFTEKGGAAALTSSSSTTDATFTTLGLRGSTDFALGTINATARGMLGWRHAFGDTTPLSTLAFAGGEAFTIAGVPIARDAALIEAGIDLKMSANATLGLSYSGQFGDGVVDQGGKIDLSVKF
ncbi:autotransporter outer membrane beta-barrel domain-containing protein [Mesorhizobium sp. M7A.F.Ca.US.011.01.1.1]|uniref:autotransporter domain-containing protein n=1 Tax=Mesorhizobium sp. M7A.F.Ca.US.011.01.1.1 TaxID=2496741 RepID=UPI000FCA16AA|nr:autotransporter domain-containing protein [Mesorhizobium sp. M7A.F.Ca.US.011.01.1.1]RUX25380.1 autotransporter outer membrane beta-barrel domain-containing protein [Mesorhizobium sp. M7A.F.Ca.US.011.01.1.1]